MNIKSYFHSCNAGDLICALAGMRQIYRKYGKKVVVYQKLDVPGHYMHGLVHSVKDEKGIQVTMNQKMFDMLRPLLLSQDYVEDFQVYTDQKFDIDLNVIRESVIIDDEHPERPAKVQRPEKFVNIPNMALPGWLMEAYPPMACDISKPWISLPEPYVAHLAAGYIFVNRTERYMSPKVNYSFLKPYENELMFIGTEREHKRFSKDFGLNFPRMEVDNFYELARALQVCRFFIGNQSFAWNLANAMGAPRIVEMFPLAPNCQPFVGEDSYGGHVTVQLKWFFEELYEKSCRTMAASGAKMM